MSQEHTQLPWEVDRPAGEKGIWIQGKDTSLVAKILTTPEDAAFIVRACNSHEVLLEAAKDLLTRLLDRVIGGENAAVERAKTAIAQAKKE